MSHFPPFEPIEYQNHHEYWLLNYELNSIIPPHEVRSYIAVHELHQETGDVTPPEIYSKLKKWVDVRLKINNYCTQHFTDQDSTLTMLTQIPTVAECANCFRSNYFGCADVYKIKFRKLRSSSIKAGKARRFRHVQRKTGDREEIYNICEQCYNHIMIPDTKQSNSYRHIWPAFIYSMLSSRDVRLKYGCNIWKLIPKEWRKWWIFPLLKFEEYATLRLDEPAPIVNDATGAYTEFVEGIDPEKNGTKGLAKMRDTVDKFLMPCASCPYGCSEYLHKGNSIPIDGIFQRYLQKVRLKLNSSFKVARQIGLRNDFLRWDDDYDIWLFNPEWKVVPTIIFDDGCPMFRICRHHTCKEGKHMLHTPRRPQHILPAACSDQLSHCIMKTRTLKQMMTKFYSNSMQMFQQSANMTGIDSCDLTNIGDFNVNSLINVENECRAIMNRADTNALLQETLVERKVMTRDIAQMRMNYAAASTSQIDFKPFYTAATYTPLQVCLDLHRKSNVHQYITIEDDEDVSRVLNPFLPHIYPCMVADDFGVMPLNIPRLYVKPSQPHACFRPFVWRLFSLIAQSEDIWRSLSTLESYKTSEWVGWMLLGIEKYAITFRSSPRLSKFSRHQMKSQSIFVDRIRNCFPDNADHTFAYCFNGISGIEVFNYRDRSLPNHGLDLSSFVSSIPLAFNDTNVIIIENYFKGRSVDEIPNDFTKQCAGSGERFVLSYVSYTEDGEEVSFMRHDGFFNHKKWWNQTSEAIPIQVDDFKVQTTGNVLVYKRVLTPDTAKLNEEFLTYIGGQNKYRCRTHNMPLIVSTRREFKCQVPDCNRTEHFCCPNPECATFICKKCVESAPEDDVTLTPSAPVTSIAEETNVDNSNDGDAVFQESAEELYAMEVDDAEDEVCSSASSVSVGSDSSGDSSILEEPFANNNSTGMDALLTGDDLDNYLTFDTLPDDLGIDAGPSYTDEVTFLDEYMEHDILTTHAGEAAFHVASDQFGSFNVSGHVLMNQCGSLMTRTNHEVKGSSKHRNMLQSLCSVFTGSCIPLLQPEGTLFPSIFWRMLPHEHVILGAIPSAIMCEATSAYGFHGLPSHVRTRLTVPFACTSTDYRAAVFYHDSLANLCATHNDTRLIVDRGLTVDDKSQLGLNVRGGSSSSSNALLGSIDSSQWVLNLCASQRYHPFDFFVTLTCNQMKHFGVRIIKNWIDSDSWTEYYPDYNSLPTLEKEEIRKALAQAAGSLILRNWQEVCQLLIHYLRTSPASPFKDVDSIFARNEYQKEVGNLSHIHLMLKVRWEALTQAQCEFVEDLICADLSSIIDSDRAMEFLESGLIERLDDLNEVYEDAAKYLPHKCNLRCQRRINETETVCKKDNIGRSTPDNTKAHFLPLPSIVPEELFPRLQRLGIMTRDENDVITFSSEYFNPSRHIPAIHPPEDFNISPVEATLFILCRSMQNVQLIRGSGGLNKYVCKYIAKVDEQNYVVISTNKNLRDQLKVTAEFLHNTKISSSAKAEKDLQDSKYSKSAPKGRMISLNEMLHVMLKYPEVITDLQFTSIPTVPLEQRSRLDLSAVDKISQRQQQVQDGAFVQPEIYSIRSNRINNQDWRQITPIELLTLNDLRMSRLTVDRITQFSLRPPELREVFDNPGKYFRWFLISKTPMKSSEMNKKITDNLDTTTFVDGFQRRVRLRTNAFEEVEAHLKEREEEGNLSIASMTIIEFFRRVISLHNDSMLLGPDDDDFDEIDSTFLTHSRQELLETCNQHLPIPVFSYTRPTQGHKFLLHVLLSMGRYHTESEVTNHASLRECFRAAKLIGPSNDPEMLQNYSDELFSRFIEEQLFYFSNSRRVLFTWMVLIGDLFDSVIVHDEMLVTDMPSVQLSSLINSTLEDLIEQKQKRKRNLIDAAFKELGEETTSKMPSKEAIFNATKDNPHVWDPVALFTQSPSQSETSYKEQKQAIEVAVHQIKKYKSLSDSHRVTKNVGIRGFPGGGKTWCSLYVTMYAMSQGLDCLATAMMASRAASLGGIHWHRWLGLPSETTTPQRMAEKALLKLGNNPVWIDVIRNLDFILADELGQLSSEFVQAINIVLCKIRRNGNLFGGILVLGTLDHTQIQPWKGRPFLSSPLIIPSFTMVKLTQSVRTQNASNYRIQQIARMKYDEITDEIVKEFQTLCKENFTFVDSWDDAEITKSTFRLYSKKVPVADATDTFIRKVLHECRANNTTLRCRDSIDTVRFVGNHMSWRPADAEHSSKINGKTKIPPKLCFFKGAIFECTYNDKKDEEFSNTDPVLLYDVPSQSDLDEFKSIPVLKLPIGWKDFEFDMTKPKEYFLSLGFKEIRIGLCPEYIIKTAMFTQAHRKQYGLRHCITGTIHGSMGDTYESLASEVSSSNPNYGLWDKGMLVVLLSRTRDPKRTIFVGSQAETIRTLTNVLRKRTMWTDYVEQILNLITVNETDPLPALTPDAFPFRIADMSLPNDNSGIVYMLNSLRERSYSYIGKTRNPSVRLYNHNAGYGAAGTESIHLRPFAVMAYIAGFEGDDSLMLALERQWKIVRNQMIRNHILDPREWARAGHEVIKTYESMASEPLSLRLVLLFQND